MIIKVVFNGLFLFKLPSDCGFFQEKASTLKESVKPSTANVYHESLVRNYVRFLEPALK